MVNEAADGADTVAWLREQPWFTGSFATIGLSYLGFTQWALLTDPPPEMKAAVITVGPHDLSATSWGTGSFALNDFLGWSDLVAHQEDPGKLRAADPPAAGPPAWWPARRAGCRWARPAGRCSATGAPWYESWLDHPDAERPVLDRAPVPRTRSTASRFRCC